jgi:predicted acylesterase/phospholipase RssA
MSTQQESEAPKAELKCCDIIMKGGITSGVIYPLALVTLSKKYRFANIGGTSAGAIAAAAAAAAEFGRDVPAPAAGPKTGFDRLAEVPNEIGPNLLGLFQPTATLKPLFDIFIAALKGKSTAEILLRAVVAAISGYGKAAAIGAAVGFLIALILSVLFAGGSGIGVFGLVFALLGAFAGLAWRLYLAVTRDLPANDYGVCPGVRQGAGGEGFTDWLARLIDEAAGRGPAQDPLTFGDLAQPNGRPPVHLAMMTTSLMDRRPFQLPIEPRIFYFEVAEWSKLFPPRIIDFLVSKCKPYTPTSGETGEFFYFPLPEDLPLVVAARMSLSFPLLISAVPLWRKDYTFTSPEDQDQLRRCLFSDGGLSSNFPIHFFDRLLPNSPTFAITLDAFDPKRHNGQNVRLPKSPVSGILLEVIPFRGLTGFLGRLVDAAKDWQDNLQSVLPGYRERIVHVALTPDEGGLNLTMDEAKVRLLADYGRRAGEKLVQDFDLDGHRWRRFLVAMARMEETLKDVNKAYRGAAPNESFDAFLARYAANPAQYKQTDPAALKALLDLGQDLDREGAALQGRTSVSTGNIPKPATNLRITPRS